MAPPSLLVKNRKYLQTIVVIPLYLFGELGNKERGMYKYFR